MGSRIKNMHHIRIFDTKEESSFSSIYDAYWERLFRYVIRILPDENDVADIVQETFIAFWEMRGKLENIKSIKSYLFVIARNLAFKRFREQVKLGDIERRLIDHYWEADESMLAEIDTRELSDIIDAEVNKLPERMREVFVLSRKEHLSYKEIAERLKISDQTVKKQINKSLKHLRLRLDEDYISYLILILAINYFN